MPKAVKAPKGATGPRYLFKKDVEPTKEGKWYPAEDVKKPVKRAFTPGTAKLRKSLVPGTIVILLAGKFKGKRAVFLKQLPSGLLLVTGASQSCVASRNWSGSGVLGCSCCTF